MSDTIALRGIRAYGKHGANPGERDFMQPFDLEIELDVDLSAARASDALPDTIDYADLHARILDDVMADARIAAARLSIAKPNLLAGATPTVILHADRASHPLLRA